jgi:hypothetical protein
MTVGLLLLISCEEIIGIDPGVSIEETLVVEGGITNLSPPYLISLRTSSNVSGVGENTLGLGAEIMVSDDQGNTTHFEEITPGNYSSADLNFVGESGRSYRLNLSLQNGEVYYSDFDLMPEPVEVLKMYDELVIEKLVNDDLVVTGDITYNRILGEFVNDRSRDLYIKSTQRMAIIQREVGLPTGCENFAPTQCYVFTDLVIPELYLLSNLEISDDFISSEIAKVAIESKGLYYTTFDVESISNEAFVFYSAIQQQLTREGTIFDPIIPKVPTNIFAERGITRNIEGFFSASSVTEYSICFDRSKAEVGIILPVVCDFCSSYFAPAVDEIPDEMLDCL